MIRYRASKLDCDACALKPRCCPNTPARKAPRSIHEGARDMARDIAATDAMQRGGYAKGGSFRDSVKDLAGQQALMTSDTDVRTMDVLGRQIQVAEEEWKTDQKDHAKLNKLVELLEKTENPDYENRAIEMLESAYETSKQYRYRFKAANIRLKQMSRMERTLRASLAAKPGDEGIKKDYAEFVKDKLNQELSIFQEAAANYPTDMSLKFQAADRMFQLGQYGEAIPIFQQARNDPKFRVAATVGLARAFLDADFVDEAIDTLKDLIEGYEVKSDSKFTEMSYWYGRALEKKGDVQAALKAYSGVAMANFNYRDVQGRIKRLRTAPAPESK